MDIFSIEFMSGSKSVYVDTYTRMNGQGIFQTMKSFFKPNFYRIAYSRQFHQRFRTHFLHEFWRQSRNVTRKKDVRMKKEAKKCGEIDTRLYYFQK